MFLFYDLSEEIISKIEKFDTNSLSAWSSELFTEANCTTFNHLLSRVNDIINKHLVEKNGSLIEIEDIFKASSSNEYYNPFKKPRLLFDEGNNSNVDIDDDGDEFKENKNNYLKTNKNNDMNLIFSLMSQVCVFSEFRKL